MGSVYNTRIYIDYCFSKIKTFIIQNLDYKKYKRYEKPFLPWNITLIAPELYIFHFYSPLQLQQPSCVFRIISATLNILLRVAFVKSIILSFLAHFVKNKKHTNLNTYLILYRNQKQNENKRVQRSLYKPKLLHFFDF
jgi:hypothetical protein